MADVRLVALGLGLLPFLAVLLYAARRSVLAARDAAWGVLIGLLAFLGLGHAMAATLLESSVLSQAVSPWALAIPVVGLALGAAACGYLLLAPSAVRALGPSRLPWAAAAYLALHSFADGLALGELVVGIGPSLIRLDAVTIGANVVHRLAEGSLVIVPALLATWRVPKALGAVSAGLLLLPGAAVLVALSGSLDPIASSNARLGTVAFANAVEAGFALLLLTTAFLPQAMESNRTRWAAWAGAAFVFIVLIHGLGELPLGG